MRVFIPVHIIYFEVSFSTDLIVVKLMKAVFCLQIFDQSGNNSFDKILGIEI